MVDQKTDGQGKGARICSQAIEILDQRPEGARFSELRRLIMEALPDANKNTVEGHLWNLEIRRPASVYKPGRGVFRHVKYRDEVVGGTETTKESVQKGQRPKEEEFYKPFADYLMNELEECNRAIALGGNLFKEKWGTPDVIGIMESRRGDIIQLPTEIVMQR